MKRLFGIALLFLSTPLFSADGPPTAYLIYQDSFTLSQLEAIADYGYKKNGQPTMMTEFLVAPNTNYARVTIATMTNGENNGINNLLSQGKIQRLSTIYLRSAYSGRIGGDESWTEVETCKEDSIKYVCYPPDWGDSWLDVEISSP